MRTAGARTLSTAPAKNECAGCAALRAEVVSLCGRVATLEASRPDRDRADADLRFALAAVHADGPGVLASDVLATRDVPLRKALEDCTIQTPGELGSWLRDHCGTRDGITIAKDRRRGRWRVTSATYMTADSGSSR